MDGVKPDWNAAVLLDRLPDERNRTRLAAGIGVGLLLAGLLVAIGLGLVVAAVIGVTLVFYAGRFARQALETRRHVIRARTQRTVSAFRTVGGRAKPVARTGAARVRATTKTAFAEGERASTTAAAAMKTAAERLRENATAKARAHDFRKEALRLNTAGSSYRRTGDPQRAAEKHMEALELTRRAGDRLGEALTLNNLGLALGAAGDDEAAIQHFEAAHEIARELDAPQYDGLIAANLATAYRRRGHDAEATRFLHVALEKLPRDSGAYHRVEEQLRHAS
jgi:tetratricopeptide (TPR) repeat protein